MNWSQIVIGSNAEVFQRLSTMEYHQLEMQQHQQEIDMWPMGMVMMVFYEYCRCWTVSAQFAHMLLQNRE